MTDRVAAFELVDCTVDEVDIELWDGPEASRGGPLESIIGTCAIGVGDLLVPSPRSTSLSASLPVSANGGTVMGNVRVVVEVRPTGLPPGYEDQQYSN